MQQPGSAAGRTLALTGASGLIGRHLVKRLVADGWRVRCLSRRDDPTLGSMDVETVRGDLQDTGALGRLVLGAVWVVHAAGVVRALDPETFETVNVSGTRNLIEACLGLAAPPRLMLVSSLSAREPGLSSYAASKWRGEQLASDSAKSLRPLIVRPPAVYGPGDRVTLPLFRQLAKGFLIAPRARGNRFSLIHVEDLAALVALLAATGPAPGQPLEPDDGADAGYGWDDLARIAATAGRPVRLIRLPRWAMSGAARLVEWLARRRHQLPDLSREKVAELFHPDWTCRTATIQDLGWRPRIPFEAGFVTTLAWYRKVGWLDGRAGQDTPIDGVRS